MKCGASLKGLFMVELLTDDIDFSAYLTESDPKAKVLPAHTWVADLKDKLRRNGTRPKVFMPWAKTFGTFEFRPGEMTVWGGVNGHGKSMLTTMVALGLMAQGQKSCIASFELKPDQTIARMARMYCGQNPFSPEYQCGAGLQALDELYDDFGEWSTDKLWIYDQHGTTDSSKVLAVVRYCARELGVHHIFIDNLAKCVKAEDDYNGQKWFVDQLFAAARDENIHVHVVHHMRKGSKESDVIDKNDFKGSGSITDQPDNIIGVWRNKAKEQDVKVNGRQSKKFDEPDVLLPVFKQRNYEGAEDDEPRIQLWFDRESWQYKAAPGDALMDFKSWTGSVGQHVERF